MNSSFFNSSSRATAMPTGAQGIMPRRSSYAAIASGAATSSTSSQQQSLFPQWAPDALWSHASSIDDDMGDFSNDAASTWREWAESRHLPSYSRAFQSLIDSRAPGSHVIGNSNSFFIPSYLRGSKYAKKLEAAHRVKVAAKRSHSRESSSTSNVGAEALRKAPSYNGVTLELVEKAPPRSSDDPEPLPSKMNAHDKHKDVEVLADGLEIKFTQSIGKDRTVGGQDMIAYSIRADAVMPQESGIYYFEVTVLTKNSDEDSPISIGIATKEMTLSRPVGWEKDSFAYHGDDGRSFCGGAHDKNYGKEYGKTGDVIGCGINFTDGTVWFTRNGAALGTAFREMKGKLFPTIGLKRPGEHVRVNFGQSPFVYNIDGRYAAEKAKVAKQIETTKTDKLAPPLEETSLIQSLVLQYLTHDGYVDTAQAFAEEVHSERTALTIDPKDKARPFEFAQNHDANSRQQIRNAILEGDVETALRITRECFPKVLDDNRRTYFHLRVRQFIEMIKHDADANNGKGKETNGDADDWLSETMQQEMELDPPAQSESSETDSYDRMETDEANASAEKNGAGSANGTNGSSLKTDAVDPIQFGKQVKREFQLDADKEMRKQLEEAFALLSYEDPESVEDVNWMLKQDKRVEVADELNSAILVSLGKPPAAALDRLIQQTTVLIDMLAHQKPTGSPGSLINVDDYLKPEEPPRRFNQ